MFVQSRRRVRTRFAVSIAITLILTLAGQASAQTSDKAAKLSAPSINDIVDHGCPPGEALVGVTVDRVRGKSAVLRPRCRPIPQDSGNEWCSSIPPAGVDCSCDGYEQLIWVRASGDGCWYCIANGNACPPDPGCSCVDAKNGSFMPMECVTQATLNMQTKLANQYASQDACFFASDTACTYRAVPGAACH